jgi:adenosylmethionine-8-amino-7-oxononanoate aminotransferase
MGDYTPEVAAAPVATPSEKQVGTTGIKSSSGVLYHQLRNEPLNIVGGRDSYLVTEDGLEILDATCGAAVSCLGHSDERVHEAILDQLKKIPYCYSMFFTNSAAESLAKFLVDSTGGKMSRAYIVSSGKKTCSCGIKIGY